MSEAESECSDCHFGRLMRTSYGMDKIGGRGCVSRAKALVD